MKKPKRREAVYTMREISRALDGTAMYAWEWDVFRRNLRRIAARKRKGKK